MRVRKAVIPVAGLGTRFLPATKAVPKEMFPIVDKPTLQFIVEEAVGSGIEDILFVTGRSKRALEDHFDFSPELENELEKKGERDLLREMREIAGMANIHFVRQKQPRGLGHAVLCAEAFVGDEPFAVLLGDDVVYNPEKPCLRQMIEKYEEMNTAILGVQRVERHNVNKYGIVDGTAVGARLFEVKTLVEKPKVEDAPSDIAILGRYIITPTIFKILAATQSGVGGEIQLTDGLVELARREKMYAYDFVGRRYDVGTKLGFLEANIEFALRREELGTHLMEYLRKLVD